MATKEKILDDLAQLFAHDKLGVDEYERRVERVIASPDEASMIQVNSDILPPSRYLATGSVRPSRSSSSAVQTHNDKVSRRDLIAFFSGSTMKGVMKAPQKIASIACFGGSTIDLRDSMIPADGMNIELIAVFGGVEIKLPQGVRLDIQGAGIFGGFSRPSEEGDEDGPIIKIRGAAIFGGVDIKIDNTL